MGEAYFIIHSDARGSPVFESPASVSLMRAKVETSHIYWKTIIQFCLWLPVSGGFGINAIFPLVSTTSIHLQCSAVPIDPLHKRKPRILHFVCHANCHMRSYQMVFRLCFPESARKWHPTVTQNEQNCVWPFWSTQDSLPYNAHLDLYYINTTKSSNNRCDIDRCSEGSHPKLRLKYLPSVHLVWRIWLLCNCNVIIT